MAFCIIVRRWGRLKWIQWCPNSCRRLEYLWQKLQQEQGYGRYHKLQGNMLVWRFEFQIWYNVSLSFSYKKKIVGTSFFTDAEWITPVVCSRFLLHKWKLALSHKCHLFHQLLLIQLQINQSFLPTSLSYLIITSFWVSTASINVQTDKLSQFLANHLLEIDTGRLPIIEIKDVSIRRLTLPVHK